MAIQLKRSLTTNINPDYVLAQGQLGVEMPAATNTAGSQFKMKIGDGSTKWSDLPYDAVSPTSLDLKLMTVNSNISSLGTRVTALENSSSGSSSADALNLQTGVSLKYGNQEVGKIVCGDEYEYFIQGPTVGIYPGKYSSAGVPCFYIMEPQTSTALSYVSETGSTVRFGLASSSKSGKIDLGSSDRKWGTLYATTGSIQTSDRSAKHDIVYLSDAQATTTGEGSSTNSLTFEDVIEFVHALNPASFVYNSDDDSNPAVSQLGLIADDLESLKILPYIGGRWQWDSKPAVYASNGAVISDAQSAGSSLGLKPIPLAVAALTCCKYLLQRVELLEEQSA